MREPMPIAREEGPAPPRRSPWAIESPGAILAVLAFMNFIN